jgi:hypothetical protein
MYQQDYDKATELFETTAAGFEMLLCPNHPDALWSKQHLSTSQLIRLESYLNPQIPHGSSISPARNISEPPSRALTQERRTK